MIPHKYRCETCKFHEDIPNAIFAKIWCNKYSIGVIPESISIVGCASHSDFNKPKRSHDVEKFYKEEQIPKYKDIIFEETEDGGAVIGYLTESPSGCPRPNMIKLTKNKYKSYKKDNENYGD